MSCLFSSHLVSSCLILYMNTRTDIQTSCLDHTTRSHDHKINTTTRIDRACGEELLSVLWDNMSDFQVLLYISCSLSAVHSLYNTVQTTYSAVPHLFIYTVLGSSSSFFNPARLLLEPDSRPDNDNDDAITTLLSTMRFITRSLTRPGCNMPNTQTQPQAQHQQHSHPIPYEISDRIIMQKERVYRYGPPPPMMTTTATTTAPPGYGHGYPAPSAQPGQSPRIVPISQPGQSQRYPAPPAPAFQESLQPGQNRRIAPPSEPVQGQRYHSPPAPTFQQSLQPGAIQIPASFSARAPEAQGYGYGSSPAPPYQYEPGQTQTQTQTQNPSSVPPLSRDNFDRRRERIARGYWSPYRGAGIDADMAEEDQRLGFQEPKDVRSRWEGGRDYAPATSPVLLTRNLEAERNPTQRRNSFLEAYHAASDAGYQKSSIPTPKPSQEYAPHS
jgi:hypothetical protein